MTAMRLARYLSQAGVASRRASEDLIREGRVEVDGKVVRNVATNVDADAAKVRVDGEAVGLQDLFYAVLNKPKGCVSTVNDPEGRPTVMDYLPRLPVKVVPVGRLDFHSEGVLLLTNDGELADKLLSPRKHVDKTYHVKIDGTISEGKLGKLRRGVRLDDGRTTKPAQVDRLKARSKHDWLVITIREGKNRQIHRMLEAVGHRLSKLQRVAFASITYEGLRVGDARELDAAEVKSLRKIAGLPHNPRANPRGKWRARREDTDHARKARAKARAEAEAEAAMGGRASRTAGREADPGSPRSGAPSRSQRVSPKKKTQARPSPRPKQAPGSRGKPARGKPARGKPPSGKPARGKPARGKPAASTARRGGRKPTAKPRTRSGRTGKKK